jgi:hypothetical protein
MRLGRFNSAVGGGPTAITPVAHDPAQTTLTGLTVNTGGTLVTLSSTFRQISRPTDEFGAGGGGFDEFAIILPLNVVWDSGYGDTNVEPIVLRQNQGLALVTEVLGTYTGSAHIHVEFTHS